MVSSRELDTTTGADMVSGVISLISNTRNRAICQPVGWSMSGWQVVPHGCVGSHAQAGMLPL